MRSSFFILKLYQREWNRVKIHFTIPKFLKVIDPYPIMSLVFDSKKEMWSVNIIKIIYILITTTVFLALYKWAVHNNRMESFLTERWDVLGIMKWVDQSVGNERMWRNGECKERGGQCKEKGKCDNKGEQKPYIQFLRTAHLYSTKHSPNSLISSHFDPLTSPFLAHRTSMLENLLYSYNVQLIFTMLWSVCSILKSGTESRFIFPNLNFNSSLIPTGSCLWFLKIWSLSTRVEQSQESF
jgi:hypothetical protein